MAEPALDLSEILDLYKDDVRRMVGQMRDAWGRWDEVVQGGPARQDLRRLAHQLRGSGRTYGFRNITRVSKAVETIMVRMANARWAAEDRVRDSVRIKIERLAGCLAAES